MKVSKRSWHYRFMAYTYKWFGAFNPEDRDDLCSYMRGLAMAPLAYPVGAVIVPIEKGYKKCMAFFKKIEHSSLSYRLSKVNWWMWAFPAFLALIGVSDYLIFVGTTGTIFGFLPIAIPVTLAFSAVFLFFGAIFFMIGIDDKRVKKWKAAGRPGDYPVSTFDLVGAWLSSRHEKVCPYIEFVDEEPNK